jgi:hypothetical protein
VLATIPVLKCGHVVGVALAMSTLRAAFGGTFWSTPAWEAVAFGFFADSIAIALVLASLLTAVISKGTVWTEALALVASSYAAAVSWTRCVATVIAGPTSLACAFEGLVITDAMPRATVGALRFRAVQSPPSHVANTDTINATALSFAF